MIINKLTLKSLQNHHNAGRWNVLFFFKYMLLISKQLLQEKCSKINTPVPKSNIELFEKETGINLPQDLKDFYLLTNGCDFKTGLNVYHNNQLIEQIQWIDRLDDILVRNKDIKENLQNYDTILENSDKYWSIGCGAFGDNVFICHSKDNFGAIYLSQKNEEYEINNNNWVIPIIKIANSLSEFIENLK